MPSMIEKYNFIPNFQTVVSTCLAFEQGKLRIEKIGVFLLLILAKYFILILRSAPGKGYGYFGKYVSVKF